MMCLDFFSDLNPLQPYKFLKQKETHEKTTKLVVMEYIFEKNVFLLLSRLNILLQSVIIYQKVENNSLENTKYREIYGENRKFRRFLNIFLSNLWPFDTNFGGLRINYKLFLNFSSFLLSKKAI